MSQLLIIGAGGHGKVVADVAAAAGHTKIAFLDHSHPARTHNGIWKIIGADTPTEGPLFCAIGDNATREKVIASFDLLRFERLIHPSAILSPSATFGRGSLAVAGVIVNADAAIGKGVILNTGASVDHDCMIGDFVHISPGARLAGGVHVGDRTWIGIGAVVREGVRIGCDVVVAAGAAVIRDVPDGSRIGGVPATYI